MQNHKNSLSVSQHSSDNKTTQEPVHKTREEILQELRERADRLNKGKDHENNIVDPSKVKLKRQELLLWGLSLLVIIISCVLGHWCASPFHRCAFVAEVVGMVVTVFFSVAGVTAVWVFFGKIK